MTTAQRRSQIVLACGGIAAAISVGIGEWIMQFDLSATHDDSSYAYFANIPQWRLTLGHFLCVLTAPLYFLGYLHLGRALDIRNTWLGKSITGLGIYSFAVGIGWIGGRVYLAIAKQGIEVGTSSESLLSALSNHNEPLIQVLRVSILLISVLWTYAILKGRSYYPKWMALFSPIVLLLGIFATYAFLPAIGAYLLPTAMNVTHLAIFGFSLYHTIRIPVN
ncbi:hypothetical protein MLD52_19445 [Puniceicoccaceae bacterium K14]|nr:hypothetical protein [Puniceicoccaceae bacterium K14]